MTLVNHEVRINHRLTAEGLGDRFEIGFDVKGWTHCTGLTREEATTLRDLLTTWIDLGSRGTQSAFHRPGYREGGSEDGELVWTPVEDVSL